MNKRVIKLISSSAIIIAIFASIFSIGSTGLNSYFGGNADGNKLSQNNANMAYAAEVGVQDIGPYTTTIPQQEAAKTSDWAYTNDKYTGMVVSTASATYQFSNNPALQTAVQTGRVWATIRINSRFNGWVDGKNAQKTTHNTALSVTGGITKGATPAQGASSVTYESEISKGATYISVSLTETIEGMTRKRAPAIDYATATAHTRVGGDFVITFQFEKPIINFTQTSAAATGKLSVSGDKYIGYTDTISSTATPATNHYFTGWYLNNKLATYNATVTSNRGNAYDISATTDYKATFLAITGDFSTSNYVYNRQGQGPRADNASISGITTTHLYTNKSGTEGYSSSSMPTEAGSYNYKVTMAGGGVTLGTRTMDFVIAKAGISSSFTQPSSILFGQTIQQSGIAATVPTSNKDGLAVAGNWVFTSGQDLKTILPIGTNGSSAATGTVTLTYKFVPTNSRSFATDHQYTAIFTINKGFSVDYLHIGENNQNNSVSYITQVVNNQAQVVLTATPSQKDNFALLAWQKGGHYDAANLTQKYDTGNTNAGVGSAIYTIQKDSSGNGIVEDECTADFRAIFIQYYTDINNFSSSVEKNYTGVAHDLVLTFNNDSVLNDYYTYSTISYSTPNKAAPMKVGKYTATFVLNKRNGEVITHVATCKLDFTVKERDITVSIDPSSVGYNNTTHWARATIYSLSVGGVVAGGVTNYMFSTDDGATWTTISTAPSNSAGCKILFTAPIIKDGTSHTKKYLFKAINSPLGTAPSDSVASSQEPVECKTDTIAPTIDISLANSHINGSWTNKDVIFNFTVTIGGSGALIEYSNDGGVSWSDTKIFSFNSDYKDLSAAESHTISWTLTAEQITNYCFRIFGGSGNSASYVAGGSNLYNYDIKIDKQAPIVNKINIDKIPNANGWINEEVTLKFTAEDNNTIHQNSGIVSIVLNNDAVFTYEDGSLNPNSNVCFLTVPDCRRYSITVTDEAGNVTVFDVYEKVDTVVPAYTLDNESYTSGKWINHDAAFNFTVKAGGSGIRLLYSEDGINYSYFEANDKFTLQPNNEDSHIQTIDLKYLFTQEQLQSYYFKVESRAGLYTVVEFGEVKIDLTAPIFTDHENRDIVNRLGYDVAGAPWVKDTQKLTFTASDDQHTVFNSQIASVKLNDGGSESVDVLFQDGKYRFDIDKCTIYTITVTDEAGNAVSYTYRLKVDQGELSATMVSAKIGTTNQDYDFSPDSWLSFVLYGDDAFVSFIFDLNFSPSGVKLEWSTNGSTWQRLTDYMFEEGNESGLEQNIRYAFAIKNEQNNAFYLRMSSASGNSQEFGIQEGWYIRIDQTAPTITNQTFTTVATSQSVSKDDVLNKWRTDALKITYSLSEAFSGVETNYIRAYAHDANVPYPVGVHNQPAYETIQPIIDGTTFSFIMDAYKKYVFIIIDNAGNITSTQISSNPKEYQHTMLLPKIDNTDGVSLTVNTTNGGNAYASGTWLFNTQDSVRFDFNISFADGSASFGPSGGRLEFSVNEGGNWGTSTTISNITQAIQDNSSIAILFSNNLAPYMIATVPQVLTYNFRVITGAGRVFNYGQGITVRKDTVAPNVEINSTTGSNPYDGNWINKDVVLNLTLTVGSSGATLYMAVSNNANADPSTLQFVLQKTYGEGDGTFRFVANATSQNGNYYYYFKVVDGSNGARVPFVANPATIKIDKIQLSANNNSYANDKEYIASSANKIWTAHDVVFKMQDIISGPSGYKVTYQTSSINAGVWSEPTAVDYDSLNDTLTIAINMQQDYRFRLMSGSGIEYVTELRTIYIDKDVPVFTLTDSNSGAERINKPGSVNHGWWIANPKYVYNVQDYGASGYTMQYALSDNGTDWRDWTSDGIASASITVSDNSGTGGTVKYYKFRLLSGSGVSSSVLDAEGALFINSNPTAIKVDTHSYSVENIQYVADKTSAASGVMYAKVNGGGTGVFKRGAIVNITVDANTNYLIKSLQTSVPYAVIGAITDNNTKSSYSVEIQGANVRGTIRFKKQVTVTYSGDTQFLQGRQITPVALSVNEPTFDIIYGALQYSITYDSNAAVPTKIGQYAVQATPISEDFIILNPTTTMTVVYFEGSGHSGTNNPYKITNYTDITYIDIYMNPSEAYDYLGEYRLNGLYCQQNDIDLTEAFVPIANFTATYDGNGYKVYYNGVYTVNGDFGFILNFEGGIQQLIVQLDINVAADDANVGLFAANSNNGMITNSAAIGSITASGNNLKVGGIVGNANGLGIMDSFADVHILGNNISGAIGGIIGDSSDILISSANYAVGNITLVNCRNSSLSSGLVVGLINGSLYEEEGVITANYYKTDNMTINGATEHPIDGDFGKIAVGNQGTVNMSAHFKAINVYDELLTNTAVIMKNDTDDITVGKLSNEKFILLGIKGKGISGDPIQVASAEDLKYLAIFPWAQFLQTADIALDENSPTLSVDSVFRGSYSGEYEGGWRKISGLQKNSAVGYGGLFGVVGGTISNLYITDIDLTYSAIGTDVYAGGVVGVLKNGAALFNIVVSGKMSLENLNKDGKIYAGGAIGYAAGATIYNITSFVTVTVNTYNAVVGGVIGQVEGENNTLNDIYNLSKVDATYSSAGTVGAVVGIVAGEVNGSNVYSVENATYANGRISKQEIGAQDGGGTITNVAILGYSAMLEKAAGGKLGDIGALYPFDSGDGSLQNPFMVSTYSQLLEIGNYMYATFALSNDITIGDLDNNGVVDDDYNHDFNSIGGVNGVFTGKLDGRTHSIYNLTESLFSVNDGQVLNMTLNVYYKVYSDANETAKDKKAKTAENEDIIFGGVAKYNRANAYVKGLVIDGSITVDVNSRIRVRVGGVVGIAYGGQIKATITSAAINVSGIVVDVGGIVGSVEGNVKLDYSSASVDLGYNIIVKDLYANGAIVNAGMVVGSIRNRDAIVVITEMPNANTYINGVNLGSKHSIGFSII